MITLRRGAALLAIALTATLSGCASNPTRGTAASNDGNAPFQDKPLAPGSGTSLAYDPAVYDPWEKTNRKTHGFNRGLDRIVMKPIARTYTKLPSPVRSGVGHFFNNLQQPVVALNLALQGHPGMAGKSVGRFAMNLTIGVAGILDPATKAGIPYYKNDFGRTFAKWGWEESRYLVLPVFGGSTVRDGVGRLVNSRTSPINTFSRKVGPWSGILYGVHSRASALPQEAFMENAEDDYLLMRDVYFQRRACQLRDCTQDDLEYELPEDLGVED